jgi:hypothetical protein
LVGWRLAVGSWLRDLIHAANLPTTNSPTKPVCRQAGLDKNRFKNYKFALSYKFGNYLALLGKELYSSIVKAFF